jgi:Sulfatase
MVSFQRVPTPDMNHIIGQYDLLFITFDSLRFDVAMRGLETGRTPVLQRIIPTWELRHTPATFTYAAHTAFFAGFLPTPARPGRHPRLFASSFQGSKTTAKETFTYPETTWIEALARVGYHTFCIGGVGFFNKQGELGSSLPSLFEHSFWSRNMSVTSPLSPREQVQKALSLLSSLETSERALMFINLSATHEPTHIFQKGASKDSPDTQLAALEAIDRELEPLLAAFRTRGGAFCIFCSDHGEAFGEDGFVGHRLAHKTVWNVPYAEFLLEGEDA